MGPVIEKPSFLDRLIDWLEKRLNLTEILSLLSVYGLLYTEVDTRKPLREALRESLAKPVPAYTRWPRVLGLITVVLLVFELMTGALLAFYYQPTAEAAYSSVRTIVRDVPYGWFIHQIHRWGAHLLLAVLLVRLGRFFYAGLYRKPRELLWVVAVALFVAGTQLELTGRLLTWNLLSYWSTVRGLEILFGLPVLGGLLAFLVGGRDITDLTLTRFYFLHVVFLPVLFAFLLYLSFATIRRVGLSPGADQRENSRATWYRLHLYDLAILLTLIFALLVTLAALLPMPFPAEADPFATPAGAQPPWYLLAAYGFLDILSNFVPHWAGSSLLLAVLILFTSLPLLESRWGKRSGRRSLLSLIMGTAIFVAWAACTLYGFLLDLP